MYNGFRQIELVPEFEFMVNEFESATFRKTPEYKFYKTIYERSNVINQFFHSYQTFKILILPTYVPIM